MGIAIHKLDGRPAELSKWAVWHGAEATSAQPTMTERLMGGMVTKSSRKVYKGLFNKWAFRRSVIGQTQFLSTNMADMEASDSAEISYVVLNFGTAQNHLQAIGYFRKVNYGVNPMREIPRLRNITNGGPARKRADET